VLASVGTVEIMGPTSLTLGDEATYSATVTDATGRAIPGAKVMWVANGSITLSGGFSNVGTSIKVTAASVGPGALSAIAGGHTGQIAVRVALGSGGALTVIGGDGGALPGALAVDQTFVVAAQFQTAAGTKSSAPSAKWSATGACTVTDLGDGSATVKGERVGTCGLTTTAMGASGTATVDVVEATGVAITGDATTLVLGGTVKLTATAVAGARSLPTVPVTWSATGLPVVQVSATGREASVTGAAVGQGMVVATALGHMASAPAVVSPVTLALDARGQRLLAGGGTTVTVTPRGTGALVGRFASVAGVSLAGTEGFASVGPATLTDDGLVTFALSGAKGPSPQLTATFGNVTSNPLAFALTTVGSVTVMGPVGPVRIGSDVDLSLDVRDASGVALTSGASATWSDPTGVLAVPATSPGFKVMAKVVKLGPSMLIATVSGVASPPYSFPGVPNTLGVTPLDPASVAVGGTATTIVTILDTDDHVVSGVPVSEMSLTPVDPSLVSVTGPVAVGDGFKFTVKGLAPTTGPGAALTAAWTMGTETVIAADVRLVVTP
jgi:hypothetical protein